jgi:hypothetical protein
MTSVWENKDSYAGCVRAPNGIAIQPTQRSIEAADSVRATVNGEIVDRHIPRVCDIDNIQVSAGGVVDRRTRRSVQREAVKALNYDVLVTSAGHVNGARSGKLHYLERCSNAGEANLAAAIYE